MTDQITLSLGPDHLSAIDDAMRRTAAPPVFRLSKDGKDQVLFVQAGDEGWDYEFYDGATGRELDGGQIDADCTIQEAVDDILSAFPVPDGTALEVVPIDDVKGPFPFLD